MGKEASLPERVVRGIWRHQLLDKERLVTTQGVPLRLLFPGVEDGGGGPDFRQAVLFLGEGESLRGDVEVHLRSSLWAAHGHHRDPAYKDVVLHVVLQDDARVPTPLFGGGLAPVLELESFLARPLGELRLLLKNPIPLPLPCQKVGQRLGSGIATLLDAAGEERFRRKASFYREALAREEGEEVLYQGIMVALGYSRNQEAFWELARCLPLRALWQLAQQQGDDVPALQALLLGAAGLLPSQRGRKVNYPPAGLATKLEERWACLGARQILEESRWHFSGVRPENFPPRRLVAAAHLLYRYRKRGLLQGLLKLVVAASAGERGYERLERGLVFYEGIDGKYLTALLGRGRAGEIAVNVLLPFYYALAEARGELELGGRFLRLYRLYPTLGENRVTRQMKMQLWGKPSWVNTAQRQQGLIHFHQCFCREGKCSLCPLASNPV